MSSSEPLCQEKARAPAKPVGQWAQKGGGAAFMESAKELQMKGLRLAGNAELMLDIKSSKVP